MILDTIFVRKLRPTLEKTGTEKVVLNGYAHLCKTPVQDFQELHGEIPGLFKEKYIKFEENKVVSFTLLKHITVCTHLQSSHICHFFYITTTPKCSTGYVNTMATTRSFLPQPVFNIQVCQCSWRTYLTVYKPKHRIFNFEPHKKFFISKTVCTKIAGLSCNRLLTEIWEEDKTTLGTGARASKNSLIKPETVNYVQYINS